VDEKWRDVQAEDRAKSHRFGTEWFPALEESSVYKWRAESPKMKDFKGIRVLCFVKREPTAAEYKVLMETDDGADLDPVPVPRWALQDVRFVSCTSVIMR
jgi:hypothetical protein